MSALSDAMLKGWFAAFIVWAEVAFGAVALLLIAELVESRWGAALRPYLFLLAGTTPLLALFFIPIALYPSHIYPWAANAGAAPADVARIFLNRPVFILFSLIMIAGASLFTALLWLDRITRLTAAIGLVFYGIAFNFLTYAWIQSIDLPFVSSALGAEMAIQNLIAAVACSAIFYITEVDVAARRDIGAFLFAICLALLYFALMSLIVNWYGNLPDQASWYERRLGGLRGLTAAAAVLLGAIIPIVALLSGDIRENPRALRWLGVSALLGVILHDLWLFIPILSPGAVICFVVALSVMALGSIWTARVVSARMGLSQEVAP